jgi:hypothetical protein
MLEEVRRWGAEDKETGGFLLARRDDEMVVDTVALAGQRGISRGWGLFQISAQAVDELFEWSEANGLWIPGQFHSHKERAFLSRTDIEHGFSVEGFISSVIPHFAKPPAAPEKWGWWMYRVNRWIPVEPPTIRQGETRKIVFDEDGIRTN